MYKKILTPLFAGIALVISFPVFSQVKVGIRAGANMSNVLIRDVDNYTIPGARLTPGFNAGLTFDIPLGQNFYLQPGALFSTKGSKFTYDANDYFLNDGIISEAGDYTRATSYYIEVPFNFIYKAYGGQKGDVLIGAGPYLAYGIGGKYKIKEPNGATHQGDLEFVSDFAEDESGDINKLTYGRPVDAGANILIGYEFLNGFSIQLNGQLGIANLEPKDAGLKPNARFKNAGFGISVGFKF